MKNIVKIDTIVSKMLICHIFHQIRRYKVIVLPMVWFWRKISLHTGWGTQLLANEIKILFACKRPEFGIPENKISEKSFEIVRQMYGTVQP